MGEFKESHGVDNINALKKEFGNTDDLKMEEINILHSSKEDLIPLHNQTDEKKLEIHSESFENVIDFVNSNKKIVVSESDFRADEGLVVRDSKEYAGKGWFIQHGGPRSIADTSPWLFTFRFFDKDGNLCDVDTSIGEIGEKISSLKDKKDYLLDVFKEQLQDSGIEFSFEAKGGIMAPYQVDNYVYERKQK